MSAMSSALQNHEGFWCPTLIEDWRNFLRRGILDDGLLKHHKAFISNIGYSLQYLQFLNFQLEETALHSTVKSQTIKSFIVTGMGVVESLTWYFLASNNFLKKESWSIVRASKSSSVFSIGGKQHRVVTRIEELRDSPIEKEITLKEMLQLFEKNKPVVATPEFYKDLNYLRKLRNKVHLQSINHGSDTDWNSFKESEMKLMKKNLFGFLSSQPFTLENSNDDLLKFLIVFEEVEDLDLNFFF